MKVFIDTPQEFYIDGYLKENLDKAKDTIQKDWDMVFSVDGYEGSGKSVFAQQVAFYCDPTFNIDRIVFTPQAFQRVILNAEKNQAVIYDEAYTGLSSRATMSQINKALVTMLAEIRQKNLFVLIVMPTFFDLDKYVALWRSRVLFHIYTSKDFERGYFAFYNIDRKKDLYVNGKKYYSYAIPSPNFIGRFTNHYTVNEQDYRDRKYKATKAKDTRNEDKKLIEQVNEVIFERLMKTDETIKVKTKIALSGLSEVTFYRKLKAYRQIEANH